MRPVPATDKGHLWLPPLRPNAQARLRLFCLPYAGGSASAYARWPERVPAGVEVRPVQLPGRWNRLREPLLRRFTDVVDALDEVLPQYIDRPFALFGHSMGALLAFELARRLRARGLPPRMLFVSGRGAPQFPGTTLPGADFSDQELVHRLRELNGMPAEVLNTPELMNLLLPVIRADFEVCRSYAYVPAAPLSHPIVVFGGAEDTESAEGRLEGWSIHTTARSTAYRLPGGHFFIHAAEALLLKALAASLNGLLAAERPLVEGVR